MRSRLALLATLVCASLGVVAAPAVAQPNGTTVPPKVTSLPPLYTMPVSGMAKGGKKFVGTFSIMRFVAGKQRVFAVGTLKGRLKGRHVTRYNVMLPASLSDASGQASQAARAAQTSTSCPVLHLVLGPINLNLLGLRVTLGGGAAANQPIVLDITAQQNGGLLGNLLCGLTNSLSGTGVLGQLQSQLGNLAATLNSLVSLLGAL